MTNQITKALQFCEQARRELEQARSEEAEARQHKDTQVRSYRAAMEYAELRIQAMVGKGQLLKGQTYVSDESVIYVGGQGDVLITPAKPLSDVFKGGEA